MSRIDGPFRQRVAMVTGSSRGIGSAIVRAFAGLGADVVVTHRKAAGSSREKGERLCAEIEAKESQALLVHCDIADRTSVRRAFQAATDRYGRLDFLVLNAARAPFKPVEELFERELRELVDTNFLGHIYCIREAVPLLEKSRGRIVFISSLGSRFHNPSYPLGAMKSAMETVVRDCAESLREKGILVNAVCGGLVRTDSFKTMRLHWDGLLGLPERLIMEPSEIADVVMFLCGPESRAVCGQTIVVDRGLGNRLFQLLAR